MPHVHVHVHDSFAAVEKKAAKEYGSEAAGKRVAAAVGFKKYGKKGMERKAEAGKDAAYAPGKNPASHGKRGTSEGYHEELTSHGYRAHGTNSEGVSSYEHPEHKHQVVYDPQGQFEHYYGEAKRGRSNHARGGTTLEKLRKVLTTRAHPPQSSWPNGS